MITLGVDLAAAAEKTAVARVLWSRGRVAVESVKPGQSNEQILAAVGGVTKVGLDCPLGWPNPFIDFVTAHRDRHPLAAHDLAGRRQLAYRMTDQFVVDQGWGRPLSVSADLIGHAAMRAAGLLATLETNGFDADRAGAGLVVESYPAAALRHWGLPSTGYKGTVGTPVRASVVDGLCERFPALDLGEYDAMCRRSDDALDAVICALIARAAAIGAVVWPTTEQLPRAQTEGWIVVPRCDLIDLLD